MHPERNTKATRIIAIPQRSSVKCTVSAEQLSSCRLCTHNIAVIRSGLFNHALGQRLQVDAAMDVMPDSVTIKVQAIGGRPSTLNVQPDIKVHLSLSDKAK